MSGHRGGFAYTGSVADRAAKQALQRLEQLILAQKTSIGGLLSRLTTAESTIVKLRARVTRAEDRVSAEAPTQPVTGVTTTAERAAAAAPIDIPNAFATWETFALSHASWEAAKAGDKNASAQICVDFAADLNPTNDPASWGALSKPVGENGGTTTKGYCAVDAIIYSNRYTGAASGAPSGVVDLISSSLTPDATPSWGASLPKRADNNWVAPA